MHDYSKEYYYANEVYHHVHTIITYAIPNTIKGQFLYNSFLDTISDNPTWLPVNQDFGWFDKPVAIESINPELLNEFLERRSDTYKKILYD